MASHTVTEVAIWADTCAGQNRNQFVSAALIQVTEDDSSNITIIHHKYFGKGHYESEVDSIHSTLDTALAGVEIYHPSEWDVIRRNARVKQP